MGPKTGEKLLEAVYALQREGFTLDQAIKLLHKAWRAMDELNDELDKCILANCYNGEDIR